MIVVIVGPTGIGKTKLSIALAKHYNTEIISGDSIQVYKGLDIGSGKITEEEKQGIEHHLLDILEPHEDFSVALFQKLVRNKIKELETKKLMPIIVGGTGFYIKSVLYDYNFENANRDESLTELYKNYTNEELHKILEIKDYETALAIHPNNRKRVLQAISRSEENKMSENKNKDVPLYDFKVIGLTMEREKLYKLINKRVDKMVGQGLIKEVKDLLYQGVKPTDLEGIGYKEIAKYLAGEWEFDYAVDKIKQHSRNLAKRQYTYFNNQFDVNWLQVNPHHFNKTIEEAIKIIEND